MSIWCSWDHIGTETYEGVEVSPGLVAIDVGGDLPDGIPVVHHKERGDVRAYCDGWSNHYPTHGFDDPVATVSLAHIPVWCVPGRDEESEEVAPWVRLTVDSAGALTWWTDDPADRPAPAPVHASVVLDEDAARALRDDLDEWLAQPKAHPKETR